jgi:very-short-patch-repair endonuclease
MTLTELKIWSALRGKQIEASRFRRQHPIGPYIADFACVENKVVIELDGGQHQEQVSYDERRTAFMQAQGWRVLRFWNNDVLSNLEGVLARVVDALGAPPPSQPSP